MKSAPRPTFRRVAASTVMLSVASLLIGCSPAAPKAVDQEPTITDPNVEVCENLVGQDVPFEDAAEVFAAYASNRESVTQHDIEQGISYLDELGAGASGDVEAGLTEMSDVLSAIRDRFVSGDPVSPSVDYQAFSDGANRVIDGCESL